MKQIYDPNFNRDDLKSKVAYILGRSSKALHLPPDELDNDFRPASVLTAIRTVKPGVADGIERLIDAYEKALTFLERFQATQHSDPIDPREQQQYDVLYQACEAARLNMLACLQAIEQ